MVEINDIMRVEKDKLVERIAKFERSKVESIFIWTMKEYEQSVSLYSVGKNLVNDCLEGFIVLWLASEIDYENWFDLNSGIEKSKAIELSEYLYRDYIESMKVELKEPMYIASYVYDRITNHVEVVKSLREKYEFCYDDFDKAAHIENAIYQNYKFVDERNFSLSHIKVLEGYETKCEDFGPIYRDLFFESDDRYWYFMG